MCLVNTAIISKSGVKIILTIESYTETNYIIFKVKAFNCISKNFPKDCSMGESENGQNCCIKCILINLCKVIDAY